MFTDWILIRRLAQELHAELDGSRVTALGHFGDGRIGIEVWRPRGSVMVAFDLFAATPVVTLEDEALVLEAERGFIRTAGAALRGLIVRDVRAKRGDRLMRFDLAARSRFGVSSGYSLVVELVPKFGNLLLLKDETIVLAYKRFAGRSATRRSTLAGAPYEPPPLSLESSAGEAELARALGSQRDAVRILRACRPMLPQLLAASVLSQVANAEAKASPLESARALLASADELLRSAEDKGVADNLIVYRSEGALVQAHVVPLHQYATLRRTAQPALLPLLSELRTEASHPVRPDRAAQRRAQSMKVLESQQRRVTVEIAAVEERIAASAARADLRAQGESIFATLHDVAETDRPEAKERAAQLFTRYKKLGASVGPLQRRLAGLLRERAAIEQLAWEVERAADDDLEDVARAVGALRGTRSKERPRAARPKRKRLAFQTEAGSRILVGRSSIENAELTFEVARPGDLWFHAQNTPGAHVILQRDDKQPAPKADIELAAGLAAFFSRAQQSPKVMVDYTQRKYVRKQPAAPPGLVFYTNPTSVFVAPRTPGEVHARAPR